MPKFLHTCVICGRKKMVTRFPKSRACKKCLIEESRNHKSSELEVKTLSEIQPKVGSVIQRKRVEKLEWDNIHTQVRWVDCKILAIVPPNVHPLTVAKKIKTGCKIMLDLCVVKNEESYIVLDLEVRKGKCLLCPPASSLRFM